MSPNPLKTSKEQLFFDPNQIRTLWTSHEKTRPLSLAIIFMYIFFFQNENMVVTVVVRQHVMHKDTNILFRDRVRSFFMLSGRVNLPCQND